MSGKPIPFKDVMSSLPDDRRMAIEADAARLREALERISVLTPQRANAADARSLHLTVKAIADAALSSSHPAPATQVRHCPTCGDKLRALPTGTFGCDDCCVDWSNEELAERGAAPHPAPTSQGVDMVLVPREPTEAMVQAAAWETAYGDFTVEDARWAWREMIAAAHQPAANEGEKP